MRRRIQARDGTPSHPSGVPRAWRRMRKKCVRGQSRPPHRSAGSVASATDFRHSDVECRRSECGFRAVAPSRRWCVGSACCTRAPIALITRKPIWNLVLLVITAIASRGERSATIRVTAAARASSGAASAAANGMRWCGWSMVPAALPAVPLCGGYCALQKKFDLVYADATPHLSAGSVAASIARTTMTRATNSSGRLHGSS